MTVESEMRLPEAEMEGTGEPEEETPPENEPEMEPPEPEMLEELLEP
jgi:hypothetical protein